MILLLIGTFLGFAIGSCFVLYYIDKEFEFVKEEKNENNSSS